MLKQLRDKMVQTRWTRVYRRGGDYTWLHEPRVRRYANECISGSGDCWPMDWFKDRYARQPFDRGLSLGCGEGLLERDVVRKQICTSILGIDLLPSAIERGGQLAREAGLEGIEYQLADMNQLRLEKNAFDIVFSHQALHHVGELETCVAEIAAALRPGGLLYLDEYLGPSRNEWKRERIATAEDAYRSLPATVRRRRRLNYPIDRSDPSEAVRSSDILPVLQRHFTITEQRDYGGNLLAIVHPYLRWDKLSQPEGEQALETLIDAERRLLASGEPSYYSVLVAELRS